MNGLLIRLVILIAIFASVFLLSQLIGRLLWERRASKAAVNRRLELLRSGLDRESVTLSLLKNVPPQLGPNAGLMQRLYVRFVRMVLMAAVRIEAKNLLLVMAGAFAGLLFLIIVLVLASRVPLTIGVVQLIIVISAAITLALPIMLLSRMAEKRRKRMEAQFPVALDVFSRSLRAGHPIASAINIVTEEMEDPIGTEFGLVSDEVVYGAELNDALLAMADRWNLEDIRMFVVSVSVQSETGGNLAEILENLSGVIRDRASMYMKVRALSSEGRMTGWMLTVLPVFTLVTMFMVNPAFYLDVAQDPIFVIGFPALFVLYMIGVFAIRRLTDLKV